MAHTKFQAEVLTPEGPVFSEEVEMLSTVTGTGSNASYRVIAWVGFYLTGIDARGSSGSLSGYFTEVIWEGLAATTAGAGGPNFGARTVRLVN